MTTRVYGLASDEIQMIDMMIGVLIAMRPRNIRNSPRPYRDDSWSWARWISASYALGSRIPRDEPSFLR
jgi:hypothetical protein